VGDEHRFRVVIRSVEVFVDELARTVEAFSSISSERSELSCERSETVGDGGSSKGTMDVVSEDADVVEVEQSLGRQTELKIGCIEEAVNGGDWSGGWSTCIEEETTSDVEEAAVDDFLCMVVVFCPKTSEGHVDKN